MNDKDEREKRISDLIKYSNMPRQQAEVAVAIEMGDIEGDALEAEDEAGETE